MAKTQRRWLVGLTLVLISTFATPAFGQSAPDDSAVADALARLEELGANLRLNSRTLPAAQDADTLFIGFRDTDFSAAELQALRTLNQSRPLVIMVRGDKLTDEGVQRLKVLTRLQRLSLRETSVTEKGIEALHKALPKLAIFRDGSPHLGLAVRDEDQGCLVRGIVPKSPAASAGIHNRDVITQFNNQRIENSSALLATVSRTNVGDNVVIEVLRDGQPLTIEVTMGTRPKLAERDKQTN